MAKFINVGVVDDEYDPLDRNSVLFDHPHHPITIPKAADMGLGIHVNDCPTIYKEVCSSLGGPVTSEHVTNAFKILTAYFIDTKENELSFNVHEYERYCSKQHPKELTVRQIERLLGYPIKIVD